jgi:hypothetical protein
MARKVPRAKGVSARSEACPEPCWTPHGTHGPCRLPGPRIRSRPGVSRGGHHASPEQPSSWEMGIKTPTPRPDGPKVCAPWSFLERGCRVTPQSPMGLYTIIPFAVLGFELKTFTLSHPPAPFCVRIFGDRVSRTIFLGR